MPLLSPEKEAPPSRAGAGISSELADTDLIRRLSGELIHEEDGQALYQRLVDAAVDIMRSDFGSMQMRDDDAGEPRLRLLAHRNFSDESARLWSVVPAAPASTCGLALEHEQRVISIDVENDERITGQGRQTYRHEGISSAQSTPLITRRGRMVGILSTHWRSLHQPTEHQLRLLDILVRQAADLLDRVQSESEVRDREAWLSGQKEAMQAALNGASLAESLGVLTRIVTAQLDDGVRAAFYLADAEGIALHHIVGMDEEYANLIDGFRIGPESHACGLATALGEPVLTVDVEQEPRWQSRLWLARRFGYRGCWSFPITTTSGSFVGTFALYWPQPRTPTLRHMRLAGHLTQTAAIIISRDAEAKERRRSEDALRDADRRKDEFLAMLAHELRNPLSAIRNASHTLCAVAESATVSQCSAMIDRQAGVLGELVDDLLDVSRITRGLVTLKVGDCNLQDIVRRAVTTLQPMSDEKRHDLRISMPSRAIRLRGDPARLEQVVLNLLGNAIKYTDSGGQLRLDVDTDDQRVELRVKDDGIGMSSDVIEHVFDLFSQAERGLARSHGGLGVGLTIVKRLVELHGGDVTAHSAGLRQGSQFIVRLPLPEAIAPAASDAAAPAAHAEAECQPMKILVVDDRTDCADSMAVLLSMHGHDVQIANDGLGALQNVGSWHPDIVMLDLGLPDIDGFEVARRIRGGSLVGNIRLIAVSGYGQDQDLARARHAGFDGHFTKPVDIGRLLDFLRDLQPAA